MGEAGGLTETVQHLMSQSAGPHNAAPVLHSVPVKLAAPASQHACGDTHHFIRACLGLTA